MDNLFQRLRLLLAGPPTEDLVVVDRTDFTTILDAASQLNAIQEQGCLEGLHRFLGSECTVCGADAYNFSSNVTGEQT